VAVGGGAELPPHPDRASIAATTEVATNGKILVMSDSWAEVNSKRQLSTTSPAISPGAGSIPRQW